MSRQRKNQTPAADRRQQSAREPAVRIIGGQFRGRKLLYTGDLRTRPMKDRVREAVFNLLTDEVAGKFVVDLFAGTGALGLEALSRGALRAVFIEQHFPTAAVLRQNAGQLGVADQVEVVPGSAFAWSAMARLDGAMPWLVFCSPPYAFYNERSAEMLSLIAGLIERAGAESVFVVESDVEYDTTRLPPALDWDVRPYPPAKVAIGRK